jgi:hypothetical protein
MKEVVITVRYVYFKKTTPLSKDYFFVRADGDHNRGNPQWFMGREHRGGWPPASIGGDLDPDMVKGLEMEYQEYLKTGNEPI